MAAKKGAKRGAPPSIGIIMGSQSDWATMRHAAETLDALAIPHEARIVSAHRTPTRLYAYARSARRRGLKVIIAGAGGAAHLPGMTAAMTPLPVLGVPVESAALKGVDSFLSMLAAAILALSDKGVAARLDRWRAQQTDSVAKRPSNS
jgi:5-(carboxyamino)imidazole ribonucleotide mutase